MEHSIHNATDLITEAARKDKILTDLEIIGTCNIWFVKQNETA
jgi:hypothetical protein